MNSQVRQAESGPEADVRIPQFDVARFRAALQTILSAAGDNHVETAAAALRCLLGVPEAHGAAYFCQAESGRLVPSGSLICHNQFADQIRGHESELLQAVEQMLHLGEPLAYPLPGQAFDIFVLPVGAPAEIAAAIAVFATAECVEGSPCLQAAQLVAIELSALKAASAIAALDEVEEVDDQTSHEQLPLSKCPQTPSISLPDATEQRVEQLIAQALFSSEQHETPKTICRRLAVCLEKALGVSQVMIGITDRHGKRCHLQAISGMVTFAEHAPLIKRIEELMAESMLHDAHFDVRRADRAYPRTAAEQSLLESTDAERICHGPLIDAGGQRVGAWIVLEHHPCEEPTDLLPAIDQLQPLLAGAVGLIRQLRADRFSRLVRRLMLTSDHDEGRRRFWVLTALAAALLLIPLPYRVRCKCELFPVTHRFVPAPYEGILKEVLVAPGDVVTEGQVLARMDAQELDWQLAASKADYMQASKKYDSSLAIRDTSAAQVAQLEMERMAAERKRLKNRVQKLEITSPISGIILGGESERLEGARIRVGENLFETGPLERMVAEVYVPDEDIAQVQAGQHVSVQLDAFPFRTFRGTVAKISPRAEDYEDENVFVAEVELDNVKDLLRPGMEGRSRVSTGWYPLAWNLFHKPLYQLLRLIRM